MNEVLDVFEDIESQRRIDVDDRKPLPPFETSDTTVLLKELLPLPVSVTGEWHRDFTRSPTISAR